MDLGIEVILELFSKKTFKELFEIAEKNDSVKTANGQRIFTLQSEYLEPLDEVIGFLQGKNQTFARQICSDNFLPRASRFDQLDDIDWAFGAMGIQDKAKHLATLYLEDLSDFIIECIDENFGFSRYAEKLGMSANSFDELQEKLNQAPTYIDWITLNILDKTLKKIQPKLICFSVPFPGNLYSAFRCAQFVKSNYPEIKVSMGGGFPNTELRSVSDPRVFDFFDYIALDDGELPIELLASNVLSEDSKLFKRTFLRENGEVLYNDSSLQKDYKQSDLGTPDYSDLLLDKYISVIEIANPMHSLWSDGRWNKLTMAHGCYWGKCTFCDISLDYIKVYEPIAATQLVDKVEELIKQTGETGFHFVDEAAPPALMKAFALEVLSRKLTITWWTNIRFEKNFTKDLCVLLQASGCIAVSGGLEVASDRLLKLIDKGITVEQVAQVTRNFTEADIMVHSYLMYGYPTQTIQETVDSLEMVRQLFEVGILQSGFWHQFSLTTHSPIGQKPDDYGIKPNYKDISFANNDIEFNDNTGIDHSQFSFGLKKSIYNYMHDIGFDIDLQEWFDFEIPHTQIQHEFIETCLNQEHHDHVKPSSKIVWLGTTPLLSDLETVKKGKVKKTLQLTFHCKTDIFEIEMNQQEGEWFVSILETLSFDNGAQMTLEQLKSDYELHFGDFELFWHSKAIYELRDNGLLVL